MKALNEAQQQADALLAEIALVQHELNTQQQIAQAAVDKVLAVFKTKEQALQDRLKSMDKALKNYGKKHMAALFDGKDKVNLTHGALLIQETSRVIRKRTVTPAILEHHGFDAAVKIAKSVDWDQLEHWPTEQLILVGTERKAKTTVEYELKEAKGKKAKK